MEAKDGPVSTEGGAGGAVAAVASTPGSAPTASPGANGGGEVKRGINMSKLAALRAKKRGQSIHRCPNRRHSLMPVGYRCGRVLCVHPHNE